MNRRETTREDAEIAVILNPTSGGGEGRRLRGEIERELARRRIRFGLTVTEAPGHAVALARDAANAGAAAVVAAGGDGTIHDVANGILTSGRARETALGIIPIGTGNDFVKVLPGTSPRPRAYDSIARGTLRPIDAGHAEWDGGEEYFLNAMGTGIDVEVVRQIARMRNLPKAAVYIAGLVKALARYVAIPMRVELNGEPLDRRVMIIGIANGCCVGGRFLLCPDARPDDGLLDVCIIREVGLARVIRLVLRILRGAHAGAPEVEMLRASSVTLRATGDAGLFLQLDGELREPPGLREVRVTVEPGALRVFADPVTASPQRPANRAPFVELEGS